MGGGTSLHLVGGRVEEFLAAGEQEIVHTKPFFFPIASAATCTDSHLGVNQSEMLTGHSECPALHLRWESFVSC
ncbi:hypothetical protein Taro_055659 [Colocasia esculenta]|uniref:Uncharacterized protein n=1 Tax=Colocasia esculenta TaxID=4460 RepID=A0A843XRW2_COLES|nr:hypothetical protein [Colocasia esculenta]